MSETALGSKHTYEGVDYYAVKETNRCVGCAFRTLNGTATAGCKAAPDCTANHIIWLAYNDYIINRLKS